MSGPAFGQAFVHPGCLSTTNDFARMKAKVQAGAHPWIDSYNILIGNSAASSNAVSHAQPVIQRGSGGGACLASDNFQFAYWDAAEVYQLSLRWHITGDNNYANTAINILNSWANTCTNLCGDPNIALLSLQGYQFACAAENLRIYTNWNAADFAKFQGWMTNVWYPLAHSWLSGHFGACATHAWANWDLCNMATVISIGVLSDRRDIYNEGINYYKTGLGAGAANEVMPFSHPGYLGQCQESGRDQGHCTLDPILLGVFCEIAWNQGDDMYGYNTNELLQVSEYVTKYNVQPLDNTVPFVTYMNCEYFNWNTEAHGIHTTVASGSRGIVRPGWSLIYNHYTNRRGLSAPWTGLMSTQVNPEGGGGNYGSNSGGYDQLGFTTLTHTLDPIASGSVPAPGKLMARPRNNTVTLSWFGSAGATSYNIKRAALLAGPYTNIASVPATTSSCTDIGLTQGSNYYYAVSARVGGAETTNSTPVSVTPNVQLRGTVIGSSGSYNWGGADKTCLFDGSLRNFYDALNGSGDWGGLDLGRSNVITQVAYCSRPSFSGRIVGGQFQGANVADFSSGVVTLYTISSAPPNNTLAYQTISNPSAFRYVRYLGPASGSCNAAEIQFFGAPSVPTPPNAPGDLAATPGNKQALLNWSAPDAAMSFNIKRSTNSGGPYTTIATGITLLNYRDMGLNNGVNYYYVVSAVNAAGESADSSEVSVLPSPGAGLGSLVWSGAVNGTWDSATLNWETNSAPAAYQDGSPVLFNDGAGWVNLTIASPVSPSSVTFNNASKSYYLYGSAMNCAGPFTKLGSGLAFLGGANSIGGGVYISAGTVTIQNSNSLGSGAVNLNGGTLSTYGSMTFGNSIIVSGADSGISLASANNLTLTGNLSGNGSLTLGNSGYNHSLYLSGPNLMSGGVVTVAGNNNYVRFTSTVAGNASADWVFNNQPGRATFDFASGTIQFGSLSGTGSIQGNVSGANSMNVTIQVGGNNNSALFSGAIHNNGWGTGPIGLTKVGIGTQWLAGACDYSGQTTVSNGGLIVSTVFAGKGNFTVANSATLGVSNTLSGSALLSNLTVAAGSTLEFRNISSTVTPLIAASNVTVGGSCAVRIADVTGLAAGNSYPLVSYAGSLSGSLANLRLQMPYGWRGTLMNSGNQVSLANVAVVPITPVQMNAGLTNGQLWLNWPSDHTGWRLLAQTNPPGAGLGANWTDVPGATSTNQITIPNISANGSVFFRMVYP